MSNDNNIEIRSEEVQEILGSPPNWIIRSVISLILFVLLILLLGTYFFKYPDIISAQVTIISKSPPTPIIAKSNGFLEEIFINDGQYVKENQIIGLIKNPANYEDILILDPLLNSLRETDLNPKQLLNINIPNNLSIGSIQSFYTNFISAWSDYSVFIKYNFLDQQVHSLSEQMTNLTEHITLQINQKKIQEKELLLHTNQFHRDSILYTKQLMAEVDFEKSLSNYYHQQSSYNNSKTNISNTQIKIDQLEQQIVELQIKKLHSEDELISSVKETLENLNAQFEIWKQTFLLISPIDGIVTYTDIWSVNQFVTNGSKVCTVVPESDQQMIGKLQIPISGSGKVKVGQKVNIKLDNFPHIEFGLVEGNIRNISLVPVSSPNNQSYYMSEIILHKGLNTNYNINLPFNQEMKGTAEIITDDKRLIERLIQPFISVFNKNIK